MSLTTLILLFNTDEDYQCYLHWLQEAARECGCAVHAYVMMTNHVHLLLTPGETGAPAACGKGAKGTSGGVRGGWDGR